MSPPSSPKCEPTNMHFTATTEKPSRRKSWCDPNEPCRFCKDYLSGGTLRQACLKRPITFKKTRRSSKKKELQNGKPLPGVKKGEYSQSRKGNRKRAEKNLDEEELANILVQLSSLPRPFPPSPSYYSQEEIELAALKKPSGLDKFDLRFFQPHDS